MSNPNKAEKLEAKAVEFVKKVPVAIAELSVAVYGIKVDGEWFSSPTTGFVFYTPYRRVADIQASLVTRNATKKVSVEVCPM